MQSKPPSSIPLIKRVHKPPTLILINQYPEPVSLTKNFVANGKSFANMLVFLFAKLKAMSAVLIGFNFITDIASLNLFKSKLFIGSNTESN